MVKSLFFLGVGLAGLAVAYAMHAERNRPASMIEAPGGLLLPPPAHRDSPVDSIRIIIAVVAGGAALLFAGRHGARLFSRAAAVRLEGGHLHFHPSYGEVSGPLALEQVRAMRFDRADRLAPDGAGSSARLGARARHALLIEYDRQGRIEAIRLVDNDFDGGADQLRRFAAFVDSHRQSAHRRGGGG